MRRCETCGAYLDAGEKCDCEQSLRDVLTGQEVENVALAVKDLPRDMRIRILGIIEGVKIASG